MKKNLLILITLLVFACSEDEPIDAVNPVACITAPSVTLAATILTFDGSCSQNATEFLWSFGDGNTSSEESPQHMYMAAGSYEVTLMVTSENGATHEDNITINVGAPPASAIKSHYSDITADETWEPGIHIIKYTIDVKDATLTIKPGAVVLFDRQTSLVIGGHSEPSTTAKLIANGTATQPIIFSANSTTPTKGFYGGIAFTAGDKGESSLSHSIIEYGGNNGGGEVPQISVGETEIAFNNNIVRHTASAGVDAYQSQSFVSFSNNTFNDVTKHSLIVSANAVTSLGTGNQYGEGKHIAIFGNLTLPQAVWNKKEAPYFLYTDVKVGSANGTILTIAPGVRFESEFSSLMIGYGGKGKLIAEGTLSDSITFTTSQTPGPEKWGGVYFATDNDPASSMKYCALEYGGKHFSNMLAMVRVEFTSVNINRCTFRNSAPLAIYCNDEGFFESFENNIIKNAGADGITMHANYAQTVGLTNIIKAKKPLIVTGRVTQNVTWPKQPFNYHIVDWSGVGSDAGNVLTIEPGVTIKFAYAFAFSMGQYSKGGLIAKGTPTEPITFSTDAATPAPKGWEAIRMYEGTMEGTILENCIIEYGGFNSSVGILHIENTNVPVIRNTVIRNSGSYGITTKSATPTLENITYSGNAFDNFKVL